MTKLTALSQEIWDMKYRLKTASGEPVDKTIADSWRRIARALAAAEPDAAARKAEEPRALEDFRFLPAGRILAGAGTERNVTLFNCFVMGDHPGRHGRHLRASEGGRPDHAAGRRHRLRLLHPAAQGRACARASAPTPPAR
jgi:hypothetical protein